MRFNFGLSEQDITIIQSACRSDSSIEKALIFGSRAKGTNKKGSDVDIALFGTHVREATAFDLSHYLNEETLLPYHFDVLCFDCIQNENLKDHIKRVGKVIYEKK